ncbi:peroxisome proliferator-activated receptor gamma coactivator 1-beta [Denticeps clupeoides]|uniref:RRM domain-containing protein n=1 Tax=Denticeps clupeoides TaxID=299321 RepID=A0AAY4EMD8_9TELE|nr:peroxisome proliferator-activated receptor gamma coactivator 1-beta [Denticeps clupeoides]
MADCASLLDEELSSFVFNYLTENSGSQYGEEEVCSDRLDADFPDIDLSQLDASDFDSVNCLSELHWCNEQSDSSPPSIHYNTDPELFEIEEENAALLAALTDSLDGIVEDEVVGLPDFPSLGEEPEEEEAEEEHVPRDGEPMAGSPSSETEDSSLLKKLLLTPNVPVGLDSNKDCSLHRHSSRTQHVKPVRPVVKSDCTWPQGHKQRAVRPAGRLCTELHRHLTTAHEAANSPTASPDSEEEDDDDEDSESDEDEEEEEEESSSSEGESFPTAEPPKPQFSSERELRSVVELIKYMHTYCLPSRKQAGWDRREGGALARRTPTQSVAAARAPPNPHRPAPPVPGSSSNASATANVRPHVPFVRRREAKAQCLLRELLQTVAPFDVSKPYRMQTPPYTHDKGVATDRKADGPSSFAGAASWQAKTELKDPEMERAPGKSAKSPEPEEASFSVRRSRRLASFPSRFAKRFRAGPEDWSVSQHPPKAPSQNCEENTQKDFLEKSPGSSSPCCNSENRACLCLPLTPKSTGDAQYGNKPFEQTLSVELCGTAGLTPPTTPPHKPVEEEIFKPEGKGETPAAKGCLWRAHIRKVPEQTELYAQLRRMGQAGDTDTKSARQRAYSDHDYCLLNLGDGHKQTPSVLLTPTTPTQLLLLEAPGYEGNAAEKQDRLQQKPEGGEEGQRETPQALSPQRPEDVEHPLLPSPSSPCCPPHSPNSDVSCSSEKSETCHRDKQRNKVKAGQQDRVDNCQVFYIHNLPSSVTQTMLRKRFEAFGDPDDCKVVIKKEERCGVVTFRQTAIGGTQWHKSMFESTGSNRRFSRKRYIDLDEAGPGPVKSKYDALDFDTLLKEAQKSLHR